MMKKTMAHGVATVLALVAAAGISLGGLAGCDHASNPNPGPGGGTTTDAETPVISAQPASAGYNYGDTGAAVTALTVSASVSDGGTLSYQWYSAPGDDNTTGTAIDGETAASYTPAIEPSGSGEIHEYYYVVVANTNTGVDGAQTAAVTSDVADITTTDAPITNVKDPVITAQPSASGSPYALNAAATLAVTADGTAGAGDLDGDLTYQWYKHTANQIDGATAIAGETAASYTLPTAAAGTAYYYVKVTGTNTGATGQTVKTLNSAIVGVTVNPATNVKAPAITVQPAAPGANYALNAAAAPLSVTANGNTGTGDLDGTLSYQWHWNTTASTVGATAIAGGTAASYTPPTATAGTLYYFVKVTGTNNAAAGITVKNLNSVVVAVTVNPAAGTNGTVALSDGTAGDDKVALTLTGAAWNTLSNADVTPWIDFASAAAGVTASATRDTDTAKLIITFAGAAYTGNVSVKTDGAANTAIKAGTNITGVLSIGANTPAGIVVTVPRSAGVYIGGAATPAAAWTTLDAALTFIKDDTGANDTAYYIVVGADFSHAPVLLDAATIGTKTKITLEGAASEKTIQLTGNGSLFAIKTGVTLTLGDHITLKGHASNNSALVNVDANGTLVMKDGSKITGNTDTTYGAGGVYVYGSTFTMLGGTISDNRTTKASSGGGVYVTGGGGGGFTMSGGTIENNTAAPTGASARHAGGVYVASTNTQFTKTNGVIRNNAATGPNVNKANSVFWNNTALGAVVKKVEGDHTTGTLSTSPVEGWD